MIETSLPGVVRIVAIRCSSIPPHAMLSAMCGAKIALGVARSARFAVRFFGEPLFKCEGSLVNGSRQESSTLEFKTSTPFPEGERLAFVVTVASGAQYLMGTREPKYPAMEYTDTAGTPSGEPALRTYRITHIAQKSLLPCVL